MFQCLNSIHVMLHSTDSNLNMNKSIWLLVASYWQNVIAKESWHEYMRM